MKVSGFTFLRNAVINGYPFEESILSVLPIVDEMIVVIGHGDDDTLDRVVALDHPKIRICETHWNENMRDRGFVYGQQKMIAQYQCSGDWAFYLEADEVLHEADLANIYSAMKDSLHDEHVEAFYFDFLHFYGTPSQVGIGGYRQAPRIIRNSIRAIAPDGLFWVILDKNKKGRYPFAKYARGTIYHYGHCRSVVAMNEKLSRVRQYWGDQHQPFEGYGSIDHGEIVRFVGTHPNIMDNWLQDCAEHSFEFDPKYKPTLRDIRNRIRFWLESHLNLEIRKKHFKAID